MGATGAMLWVLGGLHLARNFAVYVVSTYILEHVGTHKSHSKISNYFQVFYAPHPGRFPGEHASNAAGHSNGLPKVARLTTVTTVLENLRKFSNYTLQVLSFTDAGDGQLSRIISCATHSDGMIKQISYIQLTCFNIV